MQPHHMYTIHHTLLSYMTDTIYTLFYTLSLILYYTILQYTLHYTRYAQCPAPIIRQDGARQPQQPRSVVQGQRSIVYDV